MLHMEILFCKLSSLTLSSPRDYLHSCGRLICSVRVKRVMYAQNATFSGRRRSSVRQAVQSGLSSSSIVSRTATIYTW